MRAALDQRSAELAKALEAKGAALQRAEQKIVTVEGRIAEQNKAMEAEREEFEARLAKLKEQLEAEQAARVLRRRRVTSRAAGTRLTAPRGRRRARGAEGTANPSQRGRARQDHPPARVSDAAPVKGARPGRS